MSTFAIDTYTGNGSTTSYSVTFPYITTADVIVTINGVTKTLTTDYTFSNSSTIAFGSAPANGEVIKITRSSNRNARLVDYQDGSTLTEASLDQDGNQAFFMAQEAIDITTNNISLSNSTDQWDANSKRITNVADPTSAQDVATKNYLENTFLTTANKTALTTVNANIANINAVNSNATNINSAVSNATNINTVATNIGSVNTVATDIAKVITVANDLAEAVSEVETVADDLNETSSEIEVVGGAITNVNTVGNNIANVNTVAGISSNVTTVAGISSDITTVRGINLAISNVSNISNDVTAVNGNSSNINTVAGNNSNISTVAGISGNVTTVAGISSDVTSVANDATDIGTVAGISSDVTSVAGISSAVSAVNSNSSNINAVNSNSANINTVAGNNTNINTVAGVSSDVTTVAGISSDVQAVENIASNVTTVAGMSTAINTANSNSSNINTVAGAITNVNNVGGSIANVNTVAGNLSGVNSFGERYRVSSSAPGTSLDVGDLYFDTTANELKVYKSSGWANAGSTVNGTSQRFNYTATNGQTTFTGSDNNSNTLGYDAGFIDVYLNGSKLLNGTDVTVTSGTSVVLASGATTGDVVDIVTYGTFSVATLNADNLASGTVPDARITGAYTGITGLTVSGTGVVANFTSTNNNTVLRLKGSNATNGGGLGSTSSGDLTFLENLSEGMRLTSTGLGIGTSSPSAVLDVRDETNGANFIVGGSGTTNITKIGGGAGDNLQLFTNSSTAVMMLSTSGNVGIGTSSPSRKLHVLSGVGTAQIQSTGASSTLYFADTNSSTIDNQGIGSKGNDIFVMVGGTERMRIDSSGNLLLNTTSAVTGAKFSLNGGIGIDRTSSYNQQWLQYITHSGTSNYGTLYIKPQNGQTTAGLLIEDAAGNNRFQIRGSGDSIKETVVNQSGADFDFRVESNNNDNMLFVDGGTDRIGIGTSSPTQTLDVNGTVKATAFQGDGSALTGVGGGKILQVVVGTQSVTNSTSSSSFQPTTLSASITPSATSSKIAFFMSTISQIAGGITAYDLYDGSNYASGGKSRGLTAMEGNYNAMRPVSFVGLLSPNTTSAITYTVHFKSSSGTSQFGRNDVLSNLILMEVGA